MSCSSAARDEACDVGLDWWHRRRRNRPPRRCCRNVLQRQEHSWTARTSLRDQGVGDLLGLRHRFPRRNVSSPFATAVSPVGAVRRPAADRNSRLEQEADEDPQGRIGSGLGGSSGEEGRSMIHAARLFLVAGLVAVPVSSRLTPGSGAQAISKEDEAAIRKIVQAEVEAWNRGDATAYSNHFAGDGTFTNIRGQFFNGYDAFLKQHE